MKKTVLFVIEIVLGIFTGSAFAQKAGVLTNESGINLSYKIDLFKNCPDQKSNIYKVTVFWENKSGSEINIGGATVSHGIEYTVTAGYCVSGIFGSPAVFSAQTRWKNNSMLSMSYYIEVPEKDPIPAPGWTMGSFALLKENNNTQTGTPQWSDWNRGDCFPKISYRYMGKELVNLNYQYHYYFQAKNDYSETVFLY